MPRQGCLLFVLLALCACGIAMLPRIAAAIPLPSAERIAQLRQSGQWPAMQERISRLHETAVRQAPDAAATTALIEDGYGLSPQLEAPGAAHASPAANLDGNTVVDERDILELGYSQAARAVSTLRPYGTAAAGNQPQMLVLLIKFPDQAPVDQKNQGSPDVNHDAAWAHDRFLDLSAPADLQDSSVAYYFQQASYGQLELGGAVFNDPAVCDSEGWITSSQTYAALAADNSGAVQEQVMLDAIAQIDPHVDFADYDSNGDGYVDGLVTVYAGADGTGQLWYYRWLQSPGYATSGDGVRVGSGVWVSETGYLYHFCHEFGHELGLPDLYDVGGTGSGGVETGGAGWYTLMSNWNNNTGRIPPLPEAWSRIRLGWLEAVDVETSAADLALTVHRATSAGPDGTVYRLWRNGARSRQCFLLEFRDCDHGFDQMLPDPGGLMLWHVDEARTSAINRDNDFTPPRCTPECADNLNSLLNPNSDPWRDGFNGADGFDYFDDATTPNARDNSGTSTGVRIEPTSDASGASMTVLVRNAAASGLPSLSFDSPADGADVAGSAAVDVSSDAAARVEYFVNGCLKFVEFGPAPYDGFTWDTLTALNGPATLRAVAFNAGGEVVRVASRAVTVDNPAASGALLPFADDFNAYFSDTDPALLGGWNLYELDAFGLNIRPETIPGALSQGLVFAQASFPGPPGNPNVNDPNAGVYEGQDSDYLLSPRLDLTGYSGIELSFDTAFRGAFEGEMYLTVQGTTDDGASWLDLASFTNRNLSGGGTGNWDLVGAPFTSFATQTVSLEPLSGSAAYLRFKYIGGNGYGPGFCIDNLEITGVPLILATVAPPRAKVGDLVTLTGNGFGAAQGGGAVRFSDGAGGFIAQTAAVSWNNTQIVCAVPSGAKSHSSQGVRVATDGGQLTNGLELRVILAPPVIDDLDRQDL